jgi:hypothetical protein
MLNCAVPAVDKSCNPVNNCARVLKLVPKFDVNNSSSVQKATKFNMKTFFFFP